MNKKCKIIFLDLDGVIHPFNEPDKLFDFNGFLAERLNQKSVKVLNEIILATDCEIVISSDWRQHYTLLELQKIFEANKIIKTPIDVTPCVEFTNALFLERDRVIEINQFLVEHKDMIGTFCVVDDMNLPIDNLVLCARPYNEGIKQTGIKEKIIKILNNG